MECSARLHFPIQTETSSNILYWLCLRYSVVLMKFPNPLSCANLNFKKLFLHNLITEFVDCQVNIVLYANTDFNLTNHLLESYSYLCEATNYIFSLPTNSFVPAQVNNGLITRRNFKGPESRFSIDCELLVIIYRKENIWFNCPRLPKSRIKDFFLGLNCQTFILLLEQTFNASKKIQQRCNSFSFNLFLNWIKINSL